MKNQVTISVEEAKRMLETYLSEKLDGQTPCHGSVTVQIEGIDSTLSTVRLHENKELAKANKIALIKLIREATNNFATTVRTPEEESWQTMGLGRAKAFIENYFNI